MENLRKIEEAYASMSPEARIEAVLIMQGLARAMPDIKKPKLELVVSNDLSPLPLRDGRCG